MGSIATADYSVQDETARIFEQEILNNPLHASLKKYPELNDIAKRVKFTGNPSPSIPINWRFAESISSLKALEASLVNTLVARKYNVEPGNVTINTDHASLFFMSLLLTQILDDGKVKPFTISSPEYATVFKNEDKHRMAASLHRSLATNIYRTKDGRYYHCHGSMNPEPTLTALGLPLEGEDGETYDSVVKKIQSVVEQIDSKDLDHLMNEKFRQAGTIAWSSEEFFNSEHGKACEKISLYELDRIDSEHKSSWWPENSGLPSSAKRPLAGLKVVDLTRVIAAPSVTRSLAQLGASVMRVTSPNVTDMSTLHQDLSWGKWNCHLDLKSEEGRAKLRELIKDADVVVEGYRPGVMDRNGFSRKDILEIVKGRDRGIIHVKENCYGWHGPWQHRSGWQQISDAVSL
jgi:crotonobetainyl-CoA:carnitine CoA-transferase CaiB-like acyl-CoA transferase